MNLFELSVQYHKELNPKLWDGEKLKPEVLDKLREIAKHFVKFLDVPKLKVEDIVMTGSAANYNWNDKSDIDLHLLVDIKKMGVECEDFTTELFDAKKDVWADKYDITIYGLPVETYVQDSVEPHVSTGEFSIQDNKWITKPKYSPPDINTREVKAKADYFKRKIDKAIKNDAGVKQIRMIKDKIKKYRNDGLHDEGEFSTENLMFKELRNSGYLGKLAEYIKNATEEKLSLE
jgi:predicted nucleotidyltransferase